MVIGLAAETDKLQWMADIDECISGLLEQDRSRICCFVNFVICNKEVRGDEEEEEYIDNEKEQPDVFEELSVQSHGKWIKRWIALKPAHLCWFTDEKRSEIVKVIPLRLISIHVAQVTDVPWVFQVTKLCF